MVIEEGEPVSDEDMKELIKLTEKVTGCAGMNMKMFGCA